MSNYEWFGCLLNIGMIMINLVLTWLGMDSRTTDTVNNLCLLLVKLYLDSVGLISRPRTNLNIKLGSRLTLEDQKTLSSICFSDFR